MDGAINPTPKRAEQATAGDRPAASAGAWRALDASANRAGEAVRVIEDTLRFLLDDPFLTQVAKNLRHDLAAILMQGDLRLRIALRDVAGDVGAGSRAAAAPGRTTPSDLLAANAARAAQALRSLEEYAALIAPETTGAFERIRYRLYTLERAAVGAARAADLLAGIRLCVLVDGREDEARFSTLVESLFAAGVGMIQLRDKTLPVPLLVGRARAALAIARRHAHQRGERPLVLVNDRADVAAAVNADGVHTGADDLPLPLVRRVVGPQALSGRTAHSLAEAEAAVLEGADYLGIGPCFPTATKRFNAFAAPEFLSGVAGTIGLPAFAIGGITLERLPELTTLGIRRVAVASAVTQAADPAAAAAAFIEQLMRLEAPAQHP
jgi:thiamine-phosphate pyrophosphorylase